MADDYSDDTTTSGVLPTGGTVRGVLETTGDSDWFRLDLKANHGYYFAPSMANGVAPLIAVWKEGWPTVYYTTQPGGLYSNDLFIPFVPSEPGNYFLEVYRPSRAGEYTVGLQEAPDDAGNDPASARVLTTTAPVAGSFDYALDIDQFRIAAVAGTTYTVTLSTDSGNLGTAAYLRLTLEGTLSYSGNEGGATTSYSFTAKTSGEHVISARMLAYEAPAPGGLAYHMTLSAVAPAGPVTPPVTGPVTPPVTGPVTPPVHDPVTPPVTGPAVPPVVPPVITPVVPTNAGPEVVSGTATVDGAIVVILSEAALLGSRGSIDLRYGGSVVETWAAGDPRIQLSGNVLTLDPGDSGVLMPGKYSLYFKGSILTDTGGNLAKSYAYNAIEVHGTSSGGITPALKGNNDHVRGSESVADAVVIDGRPSDYKFVSAAEGVKITGPGAFKSTVSDVERVMFTDSDKVVALSLDGHLGQAFRLYTSAFDRAPDHGGLGYWLKAAEDGMSLGDIARNFIASQEFTELYGVQPKDRAFVDALYQNVLHRAGESDGVAFWMDALSRGADRGDVLAAFSESAENQAQAVELIGNGIIYTPYG